MPAATKVQGREPSRQHCPRCSTQLRRDLVLILDDLHELNGGTSVRVIDELCRQAPATLHIVLAGRNELPFQMQRLRGQGQVLEVTGIDLTFTLEETSELLRTTLDEQAEVLAPELRRVTGGGRRRCD